MITKLKNRYINSKFFAFLQSNSTKIFCLLCFLSSNLFLISYLFPIDRPIIGHDFQYHYLRVEAVKYNIENHDLFSGIDYIYFGGAGYAGFAYPEIFLYIPALLRISGMGIGESMAVFLCLCSVFSYCFMFVFLKNVSGSPVCGTIGAVLYVLSAYRLDNIITRFALGEILAYVFWPLILYGLYDFIFGEFKKPYIIGFGFVGMLLSHSISTALALGLSILVSLIFIRRIIQERRKLPKLFVTAGCAVMLTAYYWLPLLELLFSCEMSVKKTAYHTLDFVIPFTGLFRENMHNGIAGLRFPIFLLCVPRVFLTRSSPASKSYLQDENTKKRSSILIAADTFMIIGILLAIMSTTLMPWNVLSKCLDFMQFPWRFFAPASVLIIIAGTIYIFYISEFTKAPKKAMLLITAVSVLIAFVHIDISGVGHAEPFDTDHYSDFTETYHIGAGEWLPRAAQGDGLNIVRSMGDNVLLNGNKKLLCERENGTLNFELNGSENADFAILPYVWYKGYEARDMSGNVLNVAMSDNGLVQVDLRGANGTITVEHKPTPLRIAAYCISAVSIIALLTAAVIFRRRRKREFKSV
ncbi:MAG: hypothetical protein K2N56_12360 [Oscillospiraceae bacterium]|nr:hypothetical protein [Oscillospiraceae bacterium]